MGWITRRIAGTVTFVIVSAILTAWAVSTGHLSGGATLSTAWGAGILGFAFLVSLAVTHRMKVRDRIRKAWEDNARAWQEYWARRMRRKVVAGDAKAHGLRSGPLVRCSSSSV